MGNLMELLSKVEGLYLMMDIIFVSISFLILFGVAYAHYSQKITINYWLCILLIIRMCFGLT
jgi:hypothetical protein